MGAGSLELGLQEGQQRDVESSTSGSSPAKCAAEQAMTTECAGECGRSVPKGAAGAAREFYKTNIAACRTDGTSRKMLDYCRCRLQREYDSRVQPLAPSGKARTEVHSGALAFHAYAGRDRCCQDHPVAPPVSAARRCAQSHCQDVQRTGAEAQGRASVVDVCRAACSAAAAALPRSQRPRPSPAATSPAHRQRWSGSAQVVC